MNPQMEQCINECLSCYRICTQMAMNHCLEQGGRHTEPHHFRTMIACADICRTSANFMLIGTELHRHMCGACAEVCEECARSCDGLDGMEQCVEACRRCAESCRQMSQAA